MTFRYSDKICIDLRCFHNSNNKYATCILFSSQNNDKPLLIDKFIIEYVECKLIPHSLKEPFKTNPELLILSASLAARGFIIAVK